MTIAEMFLPEFDAEMNKTRKLLEALPEQITDWKPHQKSMAMNRLASHVAELPGWAVEAIERDSLDITPPANFNPEDFLCRSRQSALEKFEANIAKARKAIAAASDAHLQQPWSLKRGAHTIFTLPRATVLRDAVMNHLIHHRAQLGVYLRLQNMAVPGMYG